MKSILPNTLQAISTPALVLEENRVNSNIQRFKNLADKHQVQLRTHMKTSKCAEIALQLIDEQHPGITVSTLKEAAYFADAGCKDILYAVSLNPRKFSQLQWFYEQHIDLKVVLDDLNVAHALAEWAHQEKCRVNCLIEIDTDGHRAGIKPSHTDLIPLASVLQDAEYIEFCGVMTHGGGSYDCDSYASIQAHASMERDGCVSAAEKIRGAGIAVDMVSIGSTPTVLAADHFDGVTEIRPGVYVFFDLFQHGLEVCRLQDIALSVVTSVIGHQRDSGRIFLDAGGLALSKDHSTGSQLTDYGYGLVCDENGEPLSEGEPLFDGKPDVTKGSVVVSEVYQEHGVITVSDPQLFTRLPIGSLVRLLPNHACMTAAAYDSYYIVNKSEITAQWQRCNGW